MRLVTAGRLAPAPIENYAKKTRDRLNAALAKLIVNCEGNECEDERSRLEGSYVRGRVQE
jgi:hypothetical protein